jgi:phosphate transport system permease protein
MAAHNPVNEQMSATAVTDSLKKRSRLGESVIQGFLFFCGLLSIFTTLGIVFILFNESFAFFSRTQWETTNKPIAAEITPAATVIEVGTRGATLRDGDIVRLGEEVILIERVDGLLLTVERGHRSTAPQAHPANMVLQRANDIDVLDTIRSTKWIPQLGEFGLWPLLLATLMTAVIAMIVAIPLGLAAAIYLSEYASERVRGILKPVLEVLAGIPTVVFGYFALTFVTPILRNIFGLDTVEIFNTASAGIVVGILIIPLVSSMSEDALHAVPNSLREAAYAMGATKLETSLKVVVPAALSGIAAAFVIAMSRAIGETMVVAIASGAGPKNFDLATDSLFGYVLNPFVAAETMTGHIVRISGGDLSYDSIDYNSLFAIGLALFLMTLTLNMIARYFVTRYREVYE